MGRTQQHWAQLRSTMGWVVARVTHQEASLVPEQAVITTWSETSVFHLLRQASSTQKHSQQSSPPRRGPAGTWQDGDRKHSPLSLLLRATCWPLYLCLNVAGWCGCCPLQCHQCDSTHPTSSYPLINPHACMTSHEAEISLQCSRLKGFIDAVDRDGVNEVLTLMEWVEAFLTCRLTVLHRSCWKWAWCRYCRWW